MKYVKPEFMVEEFGLNESIALCEPEKIEQSVTLHCLKTNKHELFSGDLCSTDYYDEEGNVIVKTITYGGEEYLVWGKNDGADIECGYGCDDCNKGEKTFDAIVKAKLANGSDHIALITREFKTAINSSQ